eukprot:CAMPEP_0168361872 /NCGR_PEP_ID=MMETSP0228-20121227/2887_1 /TAXON_ID=133427 /ORGANISM="Protoceratium reticulatum, Strain CCCM 535 (=CCMP 1889)" /LENGTH=417 /DNA_ID=CAMNT_0008374557 /DNA_START=92 /DNA_END=1345 /DNA_ORIENTATION=-
MQGCIQGLVFDTLPLLLRRNPAATDVHQSKFSLIGYPFTFKFLIAPFIDAFYIRRFGKRESWLLPLKLACTLLLGYLAVGIGPLLEAQPPEMGMLVGLLFVLVLATAAGDIATDAWAAGRMDDGAASVCQSVGLTVGYTFSSTVFFLLLGKGLLDLTRLLQILASGGIMVCTLLVISLAGGPPAAEADGDEVTSFGEVLRRLYALARNSPNLRWWLGFSFLIPLLTGHSSVIAVRYQAMGFSPELFAEFDLFLLPLEFVVTWLAGRIAQTPHMLPFFSWTCVATVVLEGVSLAHYRWVAGLGKAAIDDFSARAAYVVLKQLGISCATMMFVINVAFFNRVARQHQAIAGSVITFLASISNLGGMLPATWAPLLNDSAGTEATVVCCLSAGVVVLLLFWRKLRDLEDPAHAGWHVKQA